MAKKKNEENNETKALDTIKKEMFEEFNNEIKTDLIEELNNYIDEQVKKSISNELEKTNKKILREKNRKIVIKNIIIILLVVLNIYLLYLLKNTNYFDKYFIDNNETTIIKENEDDKTKNTTPEKVEEEKEPSIEELKEEYGNLLDEIYLNESSVYLNDFYNGKLTPEIKHYFTINYLSKDNLPIEEDYNIIEESLFKEQYEKIFADSYTALNIEYNDNKVRYISKLKTYITDKIINKNKTNIIREITNIELNNNEIIITTIEGLNKNNKIYNILTEEEVCEYKYSEILKNIENLNKIIYTFNNDKKLVSISA